MIRDSSEGVAGLNRWHHELVMFPRCFARPILMSAGNKYVPLTVTVKVSFFFCI